MLGLLRRAWTYPSRLREAREENERLAAANFRLRDTLLQVHWRLGMCRSMSVDVAAAHSQCSQTLHDLGLSEKTHSWVERERVVRKLRDQAKDLADRGRHEDSKVLYHAANRLEM